LYYGILVDGRTEPVGLIHIWPVERDFSTAEWGFVLSDEYWGRGVFQRSARLLLDFAFDTLGVFRLEARVTCGNRRGIGALQRVGAKCEGTLRGGFRDRKCMRNQKMYSFLAPEFRQTRLRLRAAA
jgi:ribosomal-protein-serine acetyltransferase